MMRTAALLACTALFTFIATSCGAQSDAEVAEAAGAAEATFREFQTLAINGEAEDACSKLTDKAKRMVAGNGVSDSCEAALTALAQAFAGQQAKQLARLEKTEFDVEVDGDTATITVADVSDDEGATLIEIDGTWYVDSILG